MAAHTQSTRQWAKVVDLNKCLGCQECSSVCKMWWTSREGAECMWWAVVETRPGPGFPKDWPAETAKGRMPGAEDYGQAFDLQYARLLSGSGAEEVRILPDKELSFGPNWYGDVGEGTRPDDTWFFHLHLACMHCTKPACVEACPNRAIYKRDDGIVLINQELCKGHKSCILACPYKRIFWSSVQNCAEKCHFCFPRLEEGKAPMCAAACTGRAIFAGDIKDKTSRVYKLVHKYKVALPLHPEYGTKPNMYFIPPALSASVHDAKKLYADVIRVPEDYLQKLFGPDIRQAMHALRREREKAAAGKPSPLMDILTEYPTWNI